MLSSSSLVHKVPFKGIFNVETTRWRGGGGCSDKQQERKDSYFPTQFLGAGKEKRFYIALLFWENLTIVDPVRPVNCTVALDMLDNSTDQEELFSSHLDEVTPPLLKLTPVILDILASILIYCIMLPMELNLKIFGLGAKPDLAEWMVDHFLAVDEDQVSKQILLKASSYLSYRNSWSSVD